MSDPVEPQPGQALPSETTVLMLATFADLHRQEVVAEEDVNRTLPFFGTSLGIVVVAVTYASGHLPKWGALVLDRGVWAVDAAAALLGLAIVEAACALVWLSRAVSLRPYQRLGPEPALRDRLDALQAYYEGSGAPATGRDSELLKDMQQVLLESYAKVTPINRALNQRRYKLRARAASHVIRSLLWALVATTVVVVTDKLGYLPGVTP